jgi:hypothetical protein
VPAAPQLLLKVELPLNFSVYAMSWGMSPRRLRRRPHK